MAEWVKECMLSSNSERETSCNVSEKYASVDIQIWASK